MLFIPFGVINERHYISQKFIITLEVHLGRQAFAIFEISNLKEVHILRYFTC